MSDANLSSIGIVFFLLVFGGILGRLLIMVVAYVLSLAALILNNIVFVSLELVDGSVANLILLHFLSELMLMLVVRQNAKSFSEIECFIEQTEIADSSNTTFTALHEGMRDLQQEMQSFIVAFEEITVNTDNVRGGRWVIEENTAAIEELDATLTHLVDEQSEFGAFLQETYNEAVGLRG